MKPTRSTINARWRPCAGLVLLAALGGCNEVRLPGVYRIDVQQGNVITQQQLALLERGMEKSKVRFILGTPLVTDAFNQNRWDYYYSMERLGEPREQRVISVFFEDDRLQRVTGDVRAAAGPLLVEKRPDEVVPVPEGYRDDGLLASLTPGFLSGRAKRRVEPEAKTAAGAAGAAPASPPALEVSAEDERYLRGLLEGFGTENAGAPSGAAAQTTAAGLPAQAPGAGSAQAPGAAKEDEGLLSRWARRLGLKDDEPAPAAAAPPPAPAPPPASPAGR